MEGGGGREERRRISVIDGYKEGVSREGNLGGEQLFGQNNLAMVLYGMYLVYFKY